MTRIKNDMKALVLEPKIGPLDIEKIKKKSTMKSIIAINASPRNTWNTSSLVQEAARGAQDAGAKVEIIHLYKLENLKGCMSCFGCKLPQNLGKCIYQDDLAPILEKIRHADGLILGTPNYLGETSAAFRAFYERLIFQYLTYKKEISSYNDHQIPVLFIMTSNAPENYYETLVENYKQTFNHFIGPTQVIKCGNTLQVHNYDLYDWTIFDPQQKKEHHETVFPKEKQNAYLLGKKMVKDSWK